MALQSIYGTDIAYPNITHLAAPYAGLSSLVINDATDKIAFLITMPNTGVLNSILFSTLTVTTGDPNFSVRIESLGTDAYPSGTLAYTNASGTVAIADTDDNAFISCNINSTTGVAVTVGDIVAVVLSSSAANLQISFFEQSGQTLPCVRDYNISSVGAWSRTIGVPSLSVKISGTWATPFGCMINAGGTEAEAIGSPNERGIGLRFPFPVTVVGAWVSGYFPAASTITPNLYATPTGAPSLIASANSIDSDLYPDTQLLRYVYFTSPVTLAKNTLYVMAFAASASSSYFYYKNIPIAYAAATPAGQYSTWYARNTTGSTSFVETTGRAPIMGVIIRGFDNAVGELIGYILANNV